ncbi:MAG: hypothetical protein Q7S80_01425 [bacterium]|nr:hypothetical protein [bacterium]
MIETVKKIVVYILLFSFLLLDFPQGVFAADPTPAPVAHGFSYVYVQNQNASQQSTNIRYQWGGSTDQYIEFKSDSMSGFSYVEIDNLLGYKTLKIDGTPGSWDIYTTTSTAFVSHARPYLMVHHGSPDKVMNMCFYHNDLPSGDTHFHSGVKFYPQSATSPVSPDDLYTYDCKFFNSVIDEPTPNNPKEFVRAWGNIQGTPNANTALQGVYDGIKGSSSGAPIAAARVPVPKSENITACAASGAKRLIANDDDANKWIEAQLFQIKTVSTDPNDAGANYLKAGLTGDTSSLKQDLIEYDRRAFEDFYGDSSKNYPTKRLTDVQSQELVQKYQAVQDSLPTKWNPGYVGTISNAFLLVAAAALIWAGGLAAAGATATEAGGAAGASAAGGSAATTPAAATYISGATILEGGAVQIGELTLAAGTPAATAAVGAINAGATGFIVDGGIIFSNGVTIAVGSSELAVAATSVTTGVAASTSLGIGGGLKVIGSWIIKQKVIKGIVAAGVAGSMLYVFREWQKQRESSGSWSPIVNALNSGEYATARANYFKNMAEFALVYHYLTANNNFNKCLQDKLDPAAYYNAAIQRQADSLFGDALNSSNNFNTAPKPHGDECGTGIPTFSGIINWMVCEASKLAYEALAWFVGFAANIAQKSIGVDST